ncbi:hypothetical protein HJG60_009597 [Phyllostomus discolor]|uniref:Uncharacterized protein n=1 Tax=Phyllostomus discolor TaxID=89673 RepID=A0A833Y3J6_9CHIR|nr:hypothetical protein HJG60_009597 [Phyllostomus discolor]
MIDLPCIASRSTASVACLPDHTALPSAPRMHRACFCLSTCKWGARRGCHLPSVPRDGLVLEIQGRPQSQKDLLSLLRLAWLTLRSVPLSVSCLSHGKRLLPASRGSERYAARWKHSLNIWDTSRALAHVGAEAVCGDSTGRPPWTSHTR